MGPVCRAALKTGLDWMGLGRQARPIQGLFSTQPVTHPTWLHIQPAGRNPPLPFSTPSHPSPHTHCTYLVGCQCVLPHAGQGAPKPSLDQPHTHILSLTHTPERLSSMRLPVRAASCWTGCHQRAGCTGSGVKGRRGTQENHPGTPANRGKAGERGWGRSSQALNTLKHVKARKRL